MRFQRDPVILVQMLIIPILMSIVLLFASSFGWPETTVGVVNALLLAAGGAVAAFGVSVDAGLPLVAGIVKALLAVLLAFGLHINEVQQVVVLTIVSVIISYLTRGQVTAKEQPAVVVPAAA